MSQAKKESILSKIMNLVPGVKGYRKKEARRDMDRRLRGFIADQLDEIRGTLDELKAHLIDESELKLLGNVDKLTKKLLKTADSLRFASYGYKGFFDADAIRDVELEKIYQYDYQLLQQVNELKSSINISSTNTPELQELQKLAEHLNKLDDKITDRYHIMKSSVPE